MVVMTGCMAHDCCSGHIGMAHHCSSDLQGTTGLSTLRWCGISKMIMGSILYVILIHMQLPSFDFPDTALKKCLNIRLRPQGYSRAEDVKHVWGL